MHGAVQSCGGVRCGYRKRATGCIAAGVAASQSASVAAAIAAILTAQGTVPSGLGASRSGVPVRITNAPARGPIITPPDSTPGAPASCAKSDASGMCNSRRCGHAVHHGQGGHDGAQRCTLSPQYPARRAAPARSQPASRGRALRFLPRATAKVHATANLGSGWGFG